MVIQALVASAGDEQHVRFAGLGGGHGLQRLRDRVEVRGFRVVDEFHAVDFRDEFAAVRAGLEVRDGGNHFLQRQTQHAADRERGHDVLSVVRSAQLRLLHVQQRADPTLDAADDERAVEVDVRAAVVRAEGDKLGRLLHPERAQHRHRLGLHNGPIERLLVLEDAGLRAGVVGHRVVPVEMVRRDVQQHGDGGTEEADGLQLKRTDFEREVVELLRLVGDGTERLADVTSGEGALVAMRQDVLDELRGGGFPVRAGDRDVEADSLLPAEFQLTDDGDFALA